MVRQIVCGLLGLGLLAIPLIVVCLSGSATVDVLWTALRLAALEGIMLIYASILLSAFRPLFTRAFKPGTVRRAHVLAGAVGLSLAASHALLLLVFGWTGYSRVFLWLGLVILVLLALTIAAALARRALPRSWRWLHRLNYLVFLIALVHALRLGSDLIDAPWLRVCLFVFAATVIVGLCYSLITTRSKSRAN